MFGLLGEHLGHSYSAEIHKAFGRYDYQMFPLPPDKVAPFLTRKDFAGINVTIPYKEVVMEHCHFIDPRAKAIGAVNTIVQREGKLYGYNTDYYGFSYLIDHHGANLSGKTVLILGDGGTTKTVTAVAKDSGAAKILVASRRPKEDRISYKALAQHPEVEIIVNASPVGMYPNNGDCLVSLDEFPRVEMVIDAIYNPLVTQLLYQAQQRGILAVNGLEMLVAQAKQAAELFLQESLPDTLIDTVHRQLLEERSNVSLIGMPGAGKTSLGKELAQRTDKIFVDLDTEIEAAAGKTIPQIFAEQGETTFRRWEREIARRIGKESGQIIATGGGIVLDPENIKNLKQNGVILWIDAKVEQLAVGPGRPLAQSAEDLKTLHKARYNLYRQAADIHHPYHEDFSENAERLYREYQRFFGTSG